MISTSGFLNRRQIVKYDFVSQRVDMEELHESYEGMRGRMVGKGHEDCEGKISPEVSIMSRCGRRSVSSLDPIQSRSDEWS